MGARAYSAAMYRNGAHVEDLLIRNLHITHAINRYGWLSLTLRNPRVLDHYAVDNFIVVTRLPKSLTTRYPYDPKETLYLPPGRIEFVGQIRQRDDGLDGNGNPYVWLGCPDLKYILTSMDVDAQVGSSEAKKEDYLDDMLKEIISEQDGNLPAAFSIMADTSKAPSTTLEFPKQNVYKIAQNICKISAENGTDLYFDVVYLSPTSVQFRTMTGQPGADTTEKVLFADYIGNISQPRRHEDYMEEVTAAIAWGAGDPGNQDTSTQTDTNRTRRSPWNYREKSFNAGNVDSTALAEEARRVLNEGKPIIRFESELLDTSPNAIYGVHWHHGDKVKVGYRGAEYTGIVKSVDIDWQVEELEGTPMSVMQGKERFRARFEYSSVTGAAAS